MSDRYQLVKPSDVLLWLFDWDTDYIADTGLTISSRQWAITPEATLASATAASVKVSGLILGSVYVLTESATFSNGETKQQSITLRCEE